MKIVFMGTPQFGATILKELIKEHEVVLVVTQPDKEVGRKRIIEFSAVKKVALEKNIEVFQPYSIRKEYEYILNFDFDLIVSAAYGQIVGMKLLNHPKYKAINVHGSLLPRGRGGAPIQRAIMDGDKETGITIMYMAKGMDSGDILAQEKLEILHGSVGLDVGDHVLALLTAAQQHHILHMRIDGAVRTLLHAGELHYIAVILLMRLLLNRCRLLIISLLRLLLILLLLLLLHLCLALKIVTAAVGNAAAVLAFTALEGIERFAHGRLLFGFFHGFLLLVLFLVLTADEAFALFLEPICKIFHKTHFE